VKRKVIGNGAACRQISVAIRLDAAVNLGVADAEVLGLDQTVTNDGGAQAPFVISWSPLWCKLCLFHGNRQIHDQDHRQIRERR
jgi:hypothetical protein